MSLYHNLLNRVPVDRTYYLLLIISFLLEICNKNLGKFHGMTLAGIEIHLHDITENTIKQLLDEISTYRITWDCKRKGVDTLVQNVESLCIGSLGIRSVDFLTHIPQIVVFLVSTNEWEFVWHGIRSLQFLYVLTAVERLHTKAFICLPYQAFLEIRTLEVNLDFVKPLLGGRRRKLGKEFLFVISHNFTYIV